MAPLDFLSISKHPWKHTKLQEWPRYLQYPKNLRSIEYLRPHSASSAPNISWELLKNHLQCQNNLWYEELLFLIHISQEYYLLGIWQHWVCDTKVLSNCSTLKYFFRAKAAGSVLAFHATYLHLIPSIPFQAHQQDTWASTGVPPPQGKKET